MPESQKRPPRGTPQRLAIQEELRKARDHPSAAELYHRVRARHPKIGFATVYKTLNLLVEQGLIGELRFGDAASRYDGNPEPHSHFLCLRCSRLMDVSVNLSSLDLLSALEGREGYQVRGFRLEFYGLCPQCQAASK